MKIWMSRRTSELSVAIACLGSFSAIGFDDVLRLVQKLEHRQREEERCRNDRNANHSQQRDPARVHDR
jgi:hypothetical protein